MDSADLLGELSPPLDRQLTEALIREFIDLERRFVLGDWEPATLNGGQFAEIAARIIYHSDSGNLNRRKSVNDCLKYIEAEERANQHCFPERRSALHICRALRTIYKFRSQRGAVHIDPDYTANEMDSTLVLAVARWVMSEVLRIFWTGTDVDVARAIREIVRFDVPAILVIDGHPLVLRTDCTVEEEILLLLHNAGEVGLSRKEIGSAVPKSAPAISKALQRLCSPALRQVVKQIGSRYTMTPNGSRRVQYDLGNRLQV